MTALILLAITLGAVAVPAQKATGAIAGASAKKTATRVVALDWNLTETLIAMDVPPVGAAGIDAYEKWVGAAPMPGTVTDLGLRAQPNLELLSQLAPERILMSPRFASLEPRLSRIAPVGVVAIYENDAPLWPHMVTATRKLAAFVSRPEAGECLIRAVEETLADLAQRLPDDVPPLLVVQFADARHLRVFGAGSLYAAVLEQLGLRSAWQGNTNTWGYSLLGLGALINDTRVRAGARIVVIDPLPASLGGRLPTNGLWQRLEMVRRGDVIRLPQVWSIGGLPSARRFARLLTQALTAANAGKARHGAVSQPDVPDA